MKRIKFDIKNFSSSNFLRMAVFGVLFLLLIALVFSGKRPYKVKLHEGDISLSDVYAPYEFTYPGDIDESKMAVLREKALEAFLPLYDITQDYWLEKRSALVEFFKKLAQVSEMKNTDENLLAEKLKKDSNLNIDTSVFVPFFREDAGKLEEISLRTLDRLSSKIIADEITINELTMSHKEEIIVHDRELNVEAEIPRSDLYTPSQIKPLIEKELSLEGVVKTDLRSSFTALFMNALEPNLKYNQNETESRRKGMLEQIPPVYKQILVKKDELIIAKGQKVISNHIDKLGQLAKKDSGMGKVAYLGGIIILLITFIVMIPLYLNTYKKHIISNIKNLYLISILVLMTVFLAKLIISSPLSSYFIPLAAASMLVVILIDTGVAFMLAIMLSVFASVIAGNKFDLMIVLLVGSTAGIYFIKDVRRRSHILKAGLLVGLTKFTAICGMGLLNGIDSEVILKEGYWGIGSGIASAGIVMLLLPVFESLFKITTDITLLELSDLNHPLLKKMILNAPGTYHHSLVVGNLAESASDSIGANSLLARVGAYYHDIGKIEKAEYFSENDTSHLSPHEKLAPSMSALIIQSHVKDGAELARKFNLNQTIIDFITQHHGTGLIYYFYQRALEKVREDDVLKEEAFRYPGPKPQTKETAIVLLADAVEASSRTLSDPTPSRIKGLVQKIINNKFIDNQLDECNLTLKDLNKIAVSFSRILTGMFHTRVEYPNDSKNKKKS